MPDSNLDRRTFLYATGIAGATALAGCSSGEGSTDGGDGSDGSDGSDGGDGGSLDEEPDYGGWLDDANNYEETVDLTGEDAVTVQVGYDSLAFDPAAIAISPETEVTWEWTGDGGQHNVVSQDDGPLETELTDEEDHTYSHTFDESGTFVYSCQPHEAAGMNGAVHVV